MSSPDISARRHRLALLLKQLRIDSGMSAEDLGSALGWSQSKVSKIENGRTRPARPDVALWVDRCRAPAELRAEIMDLATLVGTEAASWREVNRRGADEQQRARGQQQADADTILVYQSEVVPGLLQTPEYARRLLVEHSRIPADQVPSAVVARLDRQAAVLFNGSTSVEFLITESALRWQPSDLATTLAQLDRILALAMSPNINIGVISRDAQSRAKPLHSFVVVRSADSVEVQVETLTAELIVTEPDDVAVYEAFFADLRTLAAFGRDMVELLHGVAEELVETSRC